MFLKINLLKIYFSNKLEYFVYFRKELKSQFDTHCNEYPNEISCNAAEPPAGSA